MCLFRVGNFRGLTTSSARLPTLFLLSPFECINQYRVFHLRECLALLAITRQRFFFFFPCLEIVQLYWISSNGTEPTQQSPNEVFLFQSCTHTHEMRCSLYICNVMHHCMSMSCHICDECHMGNLTQTFLPCFMENYITCI